MPIGKLISGGQTGVDRAALDAALDSGFPCGGWCPEGRLAEDGVLPAHYPLSELPGAGYRQRTLRNLKDADGTVILYRSSVEGGTELTLAECIRHHRPYKLIDAEVVSMESAIEMIERFASSCGLVTLNFAGPSQRRDPEIYPYAYGVAKGVISRCGFDASNPLQARKP